MKRISNGNSISLSFHDCNSLDTSDVSLFETINVKIQFNIKATTPFGSDVRVVGSIKEIGLWSVHNAITLHTSPETYPLWTSIPISISAASLPYLIEYKYIIFNTLTSTAKWETFEENRKALIKSRCSYLNIFQLKDTFNQISNCELSLSCEKKIIQDLVCIVKTKPTEDKLRELAHILENEEINYTTLQLGSLVLKSINTTKEDNTEVFSTFIEWCNLKMTLQQTKILLNSVSFCTLTLERPSEDLVSKIDQYDNSFENFDEDIVVNFNLSELRMSIFKESKNSRDALGLLLTDNNLEKKEIELLEKIMQGISEKDCIWKIVLVGKWICEMMLYALIRFKQVTIMKSQFEKLQKNENLEVLRDLLYELMELLLEVYMGISTSVDHEVCESLAHQLNTEYKLIYHDLLIVISHYLLKAIPLVNRKMLLAPVISYSGGTCKGFLHRYPSRFPKEPAKYILVISEPNEYVEIEHNIVGLLVISVDSLLLPCLIAAKSRKIPVAIGFFPPLQFDEYNLIVNEETCWLSK
ncbi:hypothetical protein SteCoe_27956 [Stentor coeruleus]|uniref:CBM20 domain-containing protein n=1 Tax=Stentor coeruleus TaxID=5963 RepID=A0A1R2B9F1_9CILI|nr:hypothetical protein SteCoe_27956 [Stentor coeruleus]